MITTDTVQLVAEALSVVPGVARVEVIGLEAGLQGLRVLCEPGTDPGLVMVGVRRIMVSDATLASEGLPDELPIEIVEEVAVGRHLSLVTSESPSSAERVDLAATRFRHPSQGAFVSNLVELARSGRARHLELLRLEVVRGRHMSVAVVLGSDGIPATGHAPVTIDGVDSALALATLRAVTVALHQDLHLVPVAATTTPMGGPLDGLSIAVVAVRVVAADAPPRTLVGVAQVEGDVREAVVRATLDAVNRRLAQHETPAVRDDRMNG